VIQAFLCNPNFSFFTFCFSHFTRTGAPAPPELALPGWEDRTPHLHMAKGYLSFLFISVLKIPLSKKLQVVR
jgi:hypothetical protein